MKKAFTLVELLIVIIIVGFIGAIMLPVIGRAREAGRIAMCTSNLRQIGIAWYLYLDDHDGRFPKAVTSPQRLAWFQFIGKRTTLRPMDAKDRFLNRYLDISSDDNKGALEITHCPSDREGSFGPGQASIYDWQGTSYYPNYWVGGENISAITASFSKLWITLETGTILGSGASLDGKRIFYHDGNCYRYGSGRTNVLFLDGHVKIHIFPDDFEWLAIDPSKKIYRYPVR